MKIEHGYPLLPLPLSLVTSQTDVAQAVCEGGTCFTYHKLISSVSVELSIRSFSTCDLLARVDLDSICYSE